MDHIASPQSLTSPFHRAVQTLDDQGKKLTAIQSLRAFRLLSREASNRQVREVTEKKVAVSSFPQEREMKVEEVSASALSAFQVEKRTLSLSNFHVHYSG